MITNIQQKYGTYGQVFANTKNDMSKIENNILFLIKNLCQDNLEAGKHMRSLPASICSITTVLVHAWSVPSRLNHQIASLPFNLFPAGSYNFVILR